MDQPYLIVQLPMERVIVTTKLKIFDTYRTRSNERLKNTTLCLWSSLCEQSSVSRGANGKWWQSRQDNQAGRKCARQQRRRGRIGLRFLLAAVQLLLWMEVQLCGLVHSNPVNGSPDNGSIRLLVRALFSQSHLSARIVKCDV